METSLKKLDREMIEALVETQEKIDKLEFDEILDFLVGQIVKVLKIERCSVFRTFPEVAKVVLVAGEPKDCHGLGMSFSFNDLEAIREVVESKKYLLVSNPWQDERVRQTRALIEDKCINAILFIPLMVEDKANVIVLDATREKKSFTEEEVYFCLALSNLVELLLERDLSRQQKEEKRILEALNEVAAEIAHQMRNPLASLGGFARRLAKELNKNEPKTERLKEMTEIILKESTRLESVLGELLKLYQENVYKS